MMRWIKRLIGREHPESPGGERPVKVSRRFAEDWFANCAWDTRHSLDILHRGIDSGLLNEQDEYGETALGLAAASGWVDGVAALIAAGADIEIRFPRTGETPLYSAVQQRRQAVVNTLLAAGANPDAANHWGVTPRSWTDRMGLGYFNQVPVREATSPAPCVQNAEHLAEHHHPKFKIPNRSERESLKVGQAVDVYVYGPPSESKNDSVKLRITERTGSGKAVRYTATIETPINETHLPSDTATLEVGPENIASVYVPRQKRS